MLDVLDLPALEKVFDDCKKVSEPINYIIHFAGKKAVAEAVEKPLFYYENNLVGSMNLMKCMIKF